MRCVLKVSILFITFFSLMHEVVAQDSAGSARSEAVAVSRASEYKLTSLVLGGGFCSMSYRDDGTAPFKYKGMGIPVDIGVKWHGHRKFDMTISSSTSLGICKKNMTQGFSVDAFDVTNTLRIKFEKNFDIYAIGLSATNFLDVTVNPNYENAAVGVSDFFGPELSARVTQPLNAFFSGTFWDDLFCHGELSMMPLAVTFRPGYSYIDNYAASHPVMDAFFSSYEWNIQPFASLGTNIGIDIYNDGFSSFSISYLWTYHLFDSLKIHLDENYNGSAPFRHSCHIISIDCYICMKAKRASQMTVKRK